MSEFKEPLDQAQILRKKFNSTQKDETGEMNALTLPPRSRTHQVKDEKKKTKIKFKYPIIRLLAMLFVLLPIAILGYTYHQSNTNPTSKDLLQGQSLYKEEISIDKQKDSNEALEKPDQSVQDDEGENQETVETPTVSNPPQPNQDSERDQALPTTDSNDTDYDIVFHEVKENDTLYSISKQYYGSREGEAIIIEWNALKGNTVENGKVLKIPLRPSK